MKILEVAGTPETPAVTLNKQLGIFEISGRSLPLKAEAFYRPVAEWIREYAKDPNPITNFVFKFEYLNTSSSRMILDLLAAMSSISGVTAFWYFQDDDEDMEEAGEEFSELVKFPFELKSY